MSADDPLPRGPGEARGSGATPARQSFQAEVSRLLHLMVHSVYTEKEIFLRELISNASDACDKLRYEAIAAPELLDGDTHLAIRISLDKAGRRITVADNGIGMSAAELADNLGTIARSGTRAFLDRLAADKPAGAGTAATASATGSAASATGSATGGNDDGAGAGSSSASGGNGASSSLIGQFGVGFYSAFMVADHIEVVSRRAGATEASVWASDGASGFTVAPASAAQAEAVPRGTAVTLAVKPGDDRFLDAHAIERIVKTYSDHILFPVELEEEGKWRQVNAASALWQRAKAEVAPEAYTQAYKQIAGSLDEPAATIHYRAEGRQSYAVLLFVPTRRPFDLYDVSRKGRVKLYVRRVYITDDADLLPSWLRFVRGVVDSEDVPLNISREMLQNNPMVAQIRRAVTGRVVAELESLSEKDRERFGTLWETFGAVIKEGIYEDHERREALLKLARFRSTAVTDWRSLKDYVAAMRPGQSEIYYLTGDSLDRLKASPQLEAAAARGVEVLLLADHVDSFWTALPNGFDGKPLKSLSQGEVDLSHIPLVAEKAEEPAGAVDIGVLVAALKTSLGSEVSDVRVSKRLVSSAACLVAPGAGPDLALDRLLQRRNEAAGLKPVLEINATHAIVKAAAQAAADTWDQEVSDLGHLLLDEARILDGELPADPARFCERMNRLVARGLGKT